MRTVAKLGSAWVVVGMGLGWLGIGAALAEGHAIVTSAQGFEAQGLAVGSAIEEGQIIETPSDKILDLSINNSVGVRLLPGTRAKLESLSASRMTLLLASGNILVNATTLSKDESFSVATPIAVAAVRGTQFWGRAIPPEQSAKPGEVTFAVREGEVELTWLKTGDKSILRPGDALDVKSSDITLMPVRRASTDEMTALAQAADVAISA